MPERVTCVHWTSERVRFNTVTQATPACRWSQFAFTNIVVTYLHSSNHFLSQRRSSPRHSHNNKFSNKALTWQWVEFTLNGSQLSYGLSQQYLQLVNLAEWQHLHLSKSESQPLNTMHSCRHMSVITKSCNSSSVITKSGNSWYVITKSGSSSSVIVAKSGSG